MGRWALMARMLAALVLGLWFAGAGAFSVLAQDGADGTPPANDEEPPAGETAQGTLLFAVYTCTAGPEGLAGAIYLSSEFSPDESCTPGGTANVVIDGNPAEAVDDGGSLTLDEGDHSVDEETFGAPVTVTVSAAEPTTVAFVFYTQAAAADVATGTLSVVTHVCSEDVANTDDFAALGDFSAQALACPAITLPGDAGAVSGESGNDAENPLNFDYAVGYDEGGTPATKTLADAGFAAASLCESDVAGADWDAGDPTDRCLDESGYAFAAVPQGTVSVALTQPPDGYVYGAAAFVPEGGEDATVLSEDAAVGTLTLDTTGRDAVTLHVFAFEQVADRVTIVKHQCGAEVASAAQFKALGDFYAKALACPTVLLDGDPPATDAVGGGASAFAFTVTGSDAASQALDAATFVNDATCEDATGQDFDGGDPANTCLDASGYQFDDVAQGSGVVVVETAAPAGSRYGAAELDPADDPAILTKAAKAGIELDTTGDGSVTLHVFNFVRAAPTETATPTATPTRTPSPTPTTPATEVPGATTGTLQVIILYCIGDSEYTTLNALAPGSDAGAGDLGDDTCVAGADAFTVDTPDGSVLAVNAGDDGRGTLDGLAPTGGAGPYTLTEDYSGESVDVEIEAGKVTNVIALAYEPDEVVDESGDYAPLDEAAAYDEGLVEDPSDEGDIESGADLAETGAGPAGAPVDGGAVLLLGAMGLLLLAGGGVVRRRSA